MRAGTDASQPDTALSHAEARDIEYNRVMAQYAHLKLEIRTLKKLLWREVARHRRANAHTTGPTTEVAR